MLLQTDRGVLLLLPTVTLDLRPLARGTWAWEGERAGRWVVRAARA